MYDNARQWEDIVSYLIKQQLNHKFDRRNAPALTFHHRRLQSRKILPPNTQSNNFGNRKRPKKTHLNYLMLMLYSAASTYPLALPASSLQWLDFKMNPCCLPILINLFLYQLQQFVYSLTLDWTLSAGPISAPLDIPSCLNRESCPRNHSPSLQQLKILQGNRNNSEWRKLSRINCSEDTEQIHP